MYYLFSITGRVELTIYYLFSITGRVELTMYYLFSITGSVELTFELPDSAKECFHEIIEKDVESTLEFQVEFKY